MLELPCLNAVGAKDYCVPIILKVIRKTSKKQISHGEAGGGSMKLKLSHNCLTSQLLQLNIILTLMIIVIMLPSSDLKISKFLGLEVRQLFDVTVFAAQYNLESISGSRF